MKIFENEIYYIEVEKSQIPWIKIFSKKMCKELSDCDDEAKKILLDTMLIVEKTMIEYYQPKKINIAMFGNYLPRLHIHVMARFEDDSFFPEPMWGKKQRESTPVLPEFKKYKELLVDSLRASLKQKR